MNKLDWEKPFPITSICREDLKEYFTERQIASLDNEDMNRIAEKMADAYCDNGFWPDMRTMVEYVLEDKTEGTEEEGRS